MPLVIIKKEVFGEGWKYGDVVGMDDEAAKVPLENGDVELYVAPKEEIKVETKTKIFKKKK